MSALPVASIKKVIRNGVQCERIYGGATLLWERPAFTQQRMNKSGNYNSGSNFSLEQVTGWVSDGTYPATVTSHKLVVQGSGTVTITAVLDQQTDDTAKPGALKLMHNSSIIATGDMTNYQNRQTITVTATDVDVAEGDTVWLQVQTGSSVAAIVYAGSYIDVNL